MIPILEKLATCYPNALYYTFKTTSEFLGAQGLLRSQHLKTILSDMPNSRSLDGFVEALYGLTHPELRWKDALNNLLTIFDTLTQTQTMADSSLEGAATSKTVTKRRQTTTSSRFQRGAGLVDKASYVLQLTIQVP